MAINTGETSSAPVLLKERNINKASLARRNPAGLGKANLLFCGDLIKRDRESRVSKTTVCLLMLTINDADLW